MKKIIACKSYDYGFTAGGFIGVPVLKQLLERDTTSTVIVRLHESQHNKTLLEALKLQYADRLAFVTDTDITEEGTFEHFANVDTIFHNAAVLPRGEAGLTQRVNVEGTQALVDFVKAHPQISKLVFCSSILVDDDTRAEEEYTKSKITGETVVDKLGARGVNLRVPRTIGPLQFTNVLSTLLLLGKIPCSRFENNHTQLTAYKVEDVAAWTVDQLTRSEASDLTEVVNMPTESHYFSYTLSEMAKAAERVINPQSGQASSDADLPTTPLEKYLARISDSLQLRDETYVGAGCRFRPDADLSPWV
ncbi:NAD-dependent epimerase/dehydratase family protein [bacterium]|nr:NAD-dependent epimerase/dehydratase family protein [bacterium]MBT4552391.1 NAD-dependent epimerase/dehydratase family protein [bacterium]MBT7088572.1 NAD-dependent epimerase/dehydratase family protein [bacterium]